MHGNAMVMLGGSSERERGTMYIAETTDHWSVDSCVAV